jgi:hypothetical protein
VAAPPSMRTSGLSAPRPAVAPTTRPAPIASAAPAPRASNSRVTPSAPVSPVAPAALKDAFLDQVKASKVFLYNTVIAQAYRIDVTPEKITLAFLPNQKVPKQQCDDARAVLESIAERVAGHKIPVAVTVAEAPPAPNLEASGAKPAAQASSDEELRREALSDPSVQALFEIFPVEKSKIEEM